MRAASGWRSRPVVAWALYDFASSTWAALLPPLFGVYFVQVIASGRNDAPALWGLVAALAFGIAGALAPFVGAFVDGRGRWIGPLAALTGLCAFATVLLALAGPGTVWLATALFVAAQAGYTLAASLYDSLVRRVSDPSGFGRVSAFGWASGLCGGIVAILAAIVVVRAVPAEAQIPKLDEVFLLAGGLYAVLAVPALHGLLRVSRERSPPVPVAARGAGATVWTTLRNWRRHREPFRFLAGYYFINDVLVTLVVFVAIILRERFGLTIEGLLWLALLYHAIAAPATIAFGHGADRWGSRRTMFAMVAILATAVVLLAIGTAPSTPLWVVALLGLVYGSIQAVSRSWFAQLAAAEKSAELFGFNAVAGRLSAALGPLAFSAVAGATGSESAAVLSLLVFLAAGVAVLSTLHEPAPAVATPPLTGPSPPH